MGQSAFCQRKYNAINAIAINAIVIETKDKVERDFSR